MVNVDLHNHLGREGKNPGFDETVDIAYNGLGPGGIFGVVNDGPEDKRYERFISSIEGRNKYERIFGDDLRMVYVPDKKITIIGVEEVETKQGHMLAAGIPAHKKIQETKKVLSLEDSLKKSQDFGTIKIPVHPFGKDGIGPYLIDHKELLEFFDALEMYNASAALWIPGILPRKANKKAKEFYYDQIIHYYDIDMGICAFTDGHSPEIIGRSYTSLETLEKSFSEIHLIHNLKKRLRKNKIIENLHMEPAKMDAFKHAWNMFLWKSSFRKKV